MRKGSPRCSTVGFQPRHVIAESRRNRDEEGGAEMDMDTGFQEVDPTGRYGRYKEVLSKGACKTVYMAFDEIDGIEVAWNQARFSDVMQTLEDLEHLYSEVNLLKTLKHKNIIKFHHSWVDPKERNINFITEIFTSGTLRQYRKKHKHVSIKAMKSWSRQILSGLLYLHSHDPPIMHRDLKCDSIFVNGNQGEVKIGDLGLATILQQANAVHNVIGTPEFMAPELYEGEYTELADIYSFGMCLLEMVTLQYPYSECANAAQIYKKVALGKKPAALAGVKDPKLRDFIEKCLVTASKRVSAKDLLMDPFLLCNRNVEEINYSTPISLRLMLSKDDDIIDNLRGSSLNSTTTSVEINNYKQREREGFSSFSSNNSNGYSLQLVGELEPIENSARTVEVQGRIEEDMVFLRLRIADSEGHIRNIHFPFDMERDTAMSVASEMVAELDLLDEDVNKIAEMIDAALLVLVPEWRPCKLAIDDIGGEAFALPHHQLRYNSNNNNINDNQLKKKEKKKIEPLQLESPRSPPTMNSLIYGRFFEPCTTSSSLSLQNLKGVGDSLSNYQVPFPLGSKETHTKEAEISTCLNEISDISTDLEHQAMDSVHPLDEFFEDEQMLKEVEIFLSLKHAQDLKDMQQRHEAALVDLQKKGQKKMSN